MAKFLVRETIACWVTFVQAVEAVDADEAREVFMDTGGGNVPCDIPAEIGHNLDGIESDRGVEVELA